jgi:hypothetical protein
VDVTILLNGKPHAAPVNDYSAIHTKRGLYGSTELAVAYAFGLKVAVGILAEQGDTLFAI